MARDGDTGGPGDIGQREDTEFRIGQARGPYDITDLATTVEELENSHLDLGSVLVPVVEGGQVTVEMSADHQPQSVYLVVPYGRITVSAFAAPKSPGLWREVVKEMGVSMREEGATVSIEDGHWGREVVAEVEDAGHRFIGVDGPRWMVRCVASGPVTAGPALAQLARAVLAETVVRRGNDPHPPREPLPVTLPPVLAEQVAAAQQQMFEQLAEDGQIDPEAFAPLAADDAQELPEGAPAQVARARVEPAVTEQPVIAEPDVDDEPDVEPDDALPPSEGSAMQRFWRRGRR